MARRAKQGYLVAFAPANARTRTCGPGLNQATKVAQRTAGTTTALEAKRKAPLPGPFSTTRPWCVRADFADGKEARAAGQGCPACGLHAHITHATHPAHATAAGRRFVLRPLGDHSIGGAHETGDRA